MVHVERLASFTDAANDILQEYYGVNAVLMRNGRAEMKDLIADPSSAMWIALVDAEPAGCVVFRHGTPTPDCGECKRLYVRPAFRRMGLADLLMDHLEQFATQTQRSWVYLDTREDFQASVKLYRQRGYLACERYNDNAQADLFFRKAIAKS